MQALRRIRGWSGESQFTLAAAIALVVGALAPWLEFGPEVGGSSYVSGIETNAGLVCLLVGVAVVWLLNRPAGPRAAAQSGAIGGLGVVAGAAVLVTLIRHWTDPTGPMWGMIVSGLAALCVLVGWFLIRGETEEDLGPSG